MPEQVDVRDPIRITVFTPAYNRGYIIDKLYRSLQRQSFRNFEWVVVDDGSTDDTEQRMAEYMSEEKDFSVRYVKTTNGGKHRAINRGVKEARGELFFIVDSDDYITDDALEQIHGVEKSIPEEEKHHFAGVCGMKAYTMDRYIGTTFVGEYLDVTTLEREANHITGDKAEVFYTEILRRYPFPEFEGEKFLTECVVWDKIAADGYKLRFYNQIAVICNYLEDGLTRNSENLILKNPRGQGLYLSQSAKFGKLSGMEKWEAYLLYFYAFHHKLSFVKISKNLQINPVALWCGLVPIRILGKLRKNKE